MKAEPNRLILLKPIENLLELLNVANILSPTNLVEVHPFL